MVVCQLPRDYIRAKNGNLVYLFYKLFPLFDFCISQHLCHFILEAFLYLY